MKSRTLLSSKKFRLISSGMKSKFIQIISKFAFTFLVTQISLVKTPKPGNISFLVGREAKNPLPSEEMGNFPTSDVAGLSWIFLDEPLNMEDYA